jgi:hypothetical protein
MRTSKQSKGKGVKRRKRRASGRSVVMSLRRVVWSNAERGFRGRGGEEEEKRRRRRKMDEVRLERVAGFESVSGRTAK